MQGVMYILLLVICTVTCSTYVVALYELFAELSRLPWFNAPLENYCSADRTDFVHARRESWARNKPAPKTLHLMNNVDRDTAVTEILSNLVARRTACRIFILCPDHNKLFDRTGCVIFLWTTLWGFLTEEAPTSSSKCRAHIPILCIGGSSSQSPAIFHCCVSVHQPAKYVMQF